MLSIEKKVVFVTFAFVILIISFNYSFTYAHESVHVQICENFGGKVSEFYVSVFLGSGHIVCQQTDEKYVSEMLVSQSNNEVFGYQMSVIGNFMLIAFYFVLVILIIEVSVRKDDNNDR